MPKTLQEIEKEIQERQKRIEKKKEEQRREIEEELYVIKNKMANDDSNLLKKVDYYTKELEHAKMIMDRRVKEAEEKYLEYRKYCENTLKSIEDHSAIQKECLENKKRAIESQKVIDEDSDKVLVRLKLQLQHMKARNAIIES